MQNKFKSGNATPQSIDVDFIERSKEIIEAHFENERFGVSELARAMGMSRSNMHRKIKSFTGMSVSRFIREVKLDNAMGLLRESSLTVSEVAYRVGFGSATYFTKCFHDRFGFPPGEAAGKEEREIISLKSGPVAGMTGPHGPGKSRVPVHWIMITIAVLAAVGIVVLNLFSSDPGSEDAIIAVLPFRNDSPDHDKAYIINGLMEEILIKLSMMEGLIVHSRTTSEMYRDSDKSIRQIGKELGADYILEGSATLLDNSTRIRIQLIEPATDRHLWSEPYERVISMDNLFEVQQEVAAAVSDELELVMQPGQRELVERKPTENLEAYDAYLQARNLIYMNSIDWDTSNIYRTKLLLERALAMDPTFLASQIWLAHTYINELYFIEVNVKKNPEKAFAYLDTGQVLAEKAIIHCERERKRNNNPVEFYSFALKLKGTCHQRRGNYEQADLYLIRSMKWRSGSFTEITGDIAWYRKINDIYSATKSYLIYNEEKPLHYITPWWLHEMMYKIFRGGGFPELAQQQSEQWQAYNEDSTSHYRRMLNLEMWNGNYRKAIRNAERLKELDPDSDYFIKYARNYIYLGETDTAVSIILDGISRLEEKGLEIGDSWVIAYVYQLLGKKEMTEKLLKHGNERNLEQLRYPVIRTQLGNTHFAIARRYSMLGDREKTLEYLEYLKDVPGVNYYFIHELENWPSFDLVKDTPEYREILHHLKSRFRKEHDRTARLLKNHNIFL